MEIQDQDGGRLLSFPWGLTFWFLGFHPLPVSSQSFSPVLTRSWYIFLFLQRSQSYWIIGLALYPLLTLITPLTGNYCQIQSHWRLGLHIQILGGHDSVYNIEVWHWWLQWGIAELIWPVNSASPWQTFPSVSWYSAWFHGQLRAGGSISSKLRLLNLHRKKLIWAVDHKLNQRECSWEHRVIIQIDFQLYL